MDFFLRIGPIPSDPTHLLPIRPRAPLDTEP
jgi:hypothetical protein